MTNIIIPIYIIFFAVLLMAILYSNYHYFKKNQELENENGDLKHTNETYYKTINDYKKRIIEIDEELTRNNKIINANKELIEKLYTQNKSLMGIPSGDMEILPDSETQPALFDGIKH